VFQAVRRHRSTKEVCIGQVCHGLGSCAERGGRVCPAHGEDQWYGEELFLSFISGHESGELQSIVRFEEEPIKAIVDVELGKVDFAFRWVGMT
jgi:hypothetical protein